MKIEDKCGVNYRLFLTWRFSPAPTSTHRRAYSLLSFFPCCHIIDMQGKADIWHFTDTRSKQRPYSDRWTRLSVIHHTGLQKQNECVGGSLVNLMFFGSWIQKWSPSIMKFFFAKHEEFTLKKMKINILVQWAMHHCCDFLPLAMNKIKLVGFDRLSSSHHQTHRTLPLISSHFLFVFLSSLARRNITLM